MKKVNWGFMAILGLGPILLILLSTFGLLAGGSFNIESLGMMTVEDIRSMIGASIILLAFFYVFVMAFTLIIPYLILIYLPASQARAIERERLRAFAQKTRQTMPTQKSSKPSTKRIPLFQPIESYIESCKIEFNSIPNERKKDLQRIANLISEKEENGDSVNLMFICTHNSRRSQFGQVLAAVAAAHYGIRNVQTFSGGTEETAFNKRAVEAIQRAGLKVEGTVSTNPRYSIRFSDEVGALDCYSKTFDTPANPQKGFAAIMTCSDADEACPIVSGADFRARITYEDPKVADRTPQEKEVYDERCQQIATEMLYLFSKVA